MVANTQDQTGWRSPLEGIDTDRLLGGLRALYAEVDRYPLWTPEGQRRWIAALRDPDSLPIMPVGPEAWPQSAAQRREQERFLRPWWRIWNQVDDRPRPAREAALRAVAEELEPRTEPLPPPTAAEIAAENARIEREHAAYLRQEAEKEARSAHEEENELDEWRRITAARRIWDEAAPLAGTLGERYLTETRGLAIPEDGWPKALRWHSGLRAVVAAMTNAHGEVQAVHRTYLTPQATNVLNTRRKKKKLSRGPMRNAWLVLPARTRDREGLRVLDGPLQAAEGLETGLTAWLATGYETWVAFGGMGSLDPQIGRLFLLCRDDDPVGMPADIAFEAKVARWRDRGVRLEVVTPWAERRGDKSDLNDVVRAASLDAVRERLRTAEMAANGFAPADPPGPMPDASVAGLRAEIAHAITGFFGRADDTPAPQILLRSATGTGKTEILGRLLPEHIAERKAKGLPHRTIDLVPEHRLGRKIEERYRAAGLDVARYEGRGDPWQPASGGREYPCRNLEEVGLALRAGAAVEEAVCGGAGDGPRCRWRDDCAYYRQLDAAKAADVVLAANALVFGEPPPKALIGDVWAAILDEDVSEHGDGTIALPISAFGEEAIAKFPPRYQAGPRRGEADTAAEADLRELYGQISQVLARAAVDTVAAAIAAERLTATTIGEAIRLSWARKVAPGMQPGMPLADRRTRALAAAINPELRKIHGILNALKDLAATGQAGNGRFALAGETITVYGLRKPSAWLVERPILVASASASADKLRGYFPRLDQVALPQPALPHQAVHQRLGAFGQRAVRGKFDELVAEVRLRSAGKKALVISHLDSEEVLRAALPGVAVRHHGGVAGDDDFSDVDVIFQFGARFAPADEISRLASARAGRLVPPEKPVRLRCRGLMADGSGVQFERLGYSCPELQREHEAIYDADYIQGLGRGRGLNRSAASPLEIWAYGNAPLEVPLAAIGRWRPISRTAKMLLAGSVHLNAADMHRFHPALFRSIDAASQFVSRAGGVAAIVAELRKLSADWPRPLSRVAWQPRGQGHKRRISVVEAERVVDFRRVVEREFGGVAAWSVVPFSVGRAPRRLPMVGPGVAEEDSDIPGIPVGIPGMSESLPRGDGRPVEPPPLGDPRPPDR